MMNRAEVEDLRRFAQLAYDVSQAVKARMIGPSASLLKLEKLSSSWLQFCERTNALLDASSESPGEPLPYGGAPGEIVEDDEVVEEEEEDYYNSQSHQGDVPHPGTGSIDR